MFLSSVCDIRVFNHSGRQYSRFSASSDAGLFIFWRPVDARHAKIRRPGVIFWRQGRRDAN